jgi:hypothetical protein
MRSSFELLKLVDPLARVGMEEMQVRAVCSQAHLVARPHSNSFAQNARELGTCCIDNQVRF